MSETDPLLPSHAQPRHHRYHADQAAAAAAAAAAADRAWPREHPIFLRVCHSPWAFVSQRVLVAARGGIAAYTAAVWGADVWRGVSTTTAGGDGGGWLLLFEAGFLSLSMQVVYFGFTFIWTLQHYLLPQNRPQRTAASRTGWSPASFRDRAFSLVSIPRTTEFNHFKRLTYSILYAFAVTFPFVITFLHFFVLGDREVGEDGKHWTGNWEHDWLMLSTFGLNSAFAASEVLLLSSVRKVQPLVYHLVALVLCTGLYFAWTRLGKLLTGKYAYDQLDPSLAGGEAYFVNLVTAMALTVAAFVAVLGLHNLRDFVARKAECDRQH